MRGNGRVYKPKDSRFWYIDYSVPGVPRQRVSSKSTSKHEAYKLLRKRLGERDDRRVIGDPRSVTLATLRQLAETRYELDGRKSLMRLKAAYAHLEKGLGKDTPVPSLTSPQFDAYAAKRIAAGAARATVNYELAALRRGFRIAVKNGLLGSMPSFELPKVQNARSGFFEEGDFAALILELPGTVRPLIRFLRFTGWRRGEALGLTWDTVDFEGQTIRLPGAQTKSGEPRVFPFGAFPALRELLAEQRRIQNGPHVFQVDGAPINVNRLRKAWARAIKRADLPGRLIHDLRRTAARDMRRAGLAESDIQELCGWETREMFKRYAITDEQHLARKVGQFASGIVAAQPSPAADSASSLS